MASSNVAPSAATGMPGMNTDHPPASPTTSALGPSRLRSRRSRSASTTAAVVPFRWTTTGRPSAAASRTSFKCPLASLKLLKLRTDMTQGYETYVKYVKDVTFGRFGGQWATQPGRRVTRVRDRLP